MGASNKKSAPSPCQGSGTAPDAFHKSHILGKKLGRGAFAQVRIAVCVKDKCTKDIAAVKILDIRGDSMFKTMSLKNDARSEGELWRLAARNHPNIVQLHEVYYDAVCCYFVMEKCASSILHHLQSLTDINERSLGKVFTQMLLGISQIHSVKVVHRDVKLDNFLVGGKDGMTIKLTDFGVSSALPSDGKLKHIAGTAPFMCPEMLSGKYYNEKADVWSMGVIAYALLYGDFPYSSEAGRSEEIKKAIVVGDAPTFQPIAIACGTYRSPTARAFVESLLEREPAYRPSADDALSKPYMVAVGKDEHMPELELPSLSDILYSARENGAFEVHNLKETTDLDDYLNKMQVRKQGISLRRSCESSLFTKVRDTSEAKTLRKTNPRSPKPRRLDSLAFKNMPSDASVFRNMSSDASVFRIMSSDASTATGGASICAASTRLSPHESLASFHPHCVESDDDVLE